LRQPLNARSNKLETIAHHTLPKGRELALHQPKGIDNGTCGRKWHKPPETSYPKKWLEEKP
jgi:hypothetical protein